MDIPKILKFLYPNAIWSIGEDYESLKWPEQSDPKPSWQQLIDAEPAYLIQATIKEFGLNIQALIDSVAMQKQYETALHCASYAASTVDAWNIEAKHFIAWRDSVWSYSYTELAKFERGERQAVSFEEFLTELPTMVWP